MNLMPDIVYTYMGISYVYIYTVPSNIYNRHETSQILTSRPHSNIRRHSSSNAPYSHNLGNNPFRTFLCDLLHQYAGHTQRNTYISDSTEVTQPYHHTTIKSRYHRSIPSSRPVWNEMRPDLTVDNPGFRTYTHDLVSTLSPANYSRATMNAIDHICIDNLLRSAHTTINQYFSVFVTIQQCVYEQQFPCSQTTPHIMSLYWDHAISQPGLL